MSLAAHIASQRTEHGIPHAVSCRALDVSESWFYKWHGRPPTARQARRDALDAEVKRFFDASGGSYGSPRVHVDLVEAGWCVSVNSVAASMARQELVARTKRRRKGLTRPDKAAVPAGDLICRDFTAEAPNSRWVGDIKQIDTGEGKLYLATAIDLFSRAVPGFAFSDHPDAALACDAITTAVASRGGRDAIRGVIFHTDRGSTYTAGDFGRLCGRLDIVQSMGRVGSCFDNAAAESFFSTLEWELLSHCIFETKEEARQKISTWICDWYNRRRRHSSAGMQSPHTYERATTLANAA